MLLVYFRVNRYGIRIEPNIVAFDNQFLRVWDWISFVFDHPRIA